MSDLYIAAPLAIDEAADGSVWIAPLPAGPISEVRGGGALILDVLLRSRRARTAREIAEEITRVLDEVPDDLEAQVTMFLEGLVEVGAVRRSSGRDSG